MPTDREIFAAAQAGLVGGSGELARDPLFGGAPGQNTGVVRDLNRRSFTIVKLAVDPAATDNTANGVGNTTFSTALVMPRRGRLVGAWVLPQANAAASNTNFATINITKDNGGGGTQTVILSTNTRPVVNGGGGPLVVSQLLNANAGVIDENIQSTGNRNDFCHGSLNTFLISHL
jgi:hypothetical protein